MTDSHSAKVVPGLAPGILIAAPNMTDPRFSEAVVLLARHDEDGAVGFVINEASPLPLEELLSEIEEDLAELAGQRDLSEAQILVGGPVQPNSFWIVFEKSEDEELDPEALDSTVFDLSPSLAVANSFDILEEFIRGEREGRFHVIAGYSGWGEGQLKEEMNTGSWIPADLEPSLLFEAPMKDRWDHALAGLGLQRGFFMASTIGVA